MKSDTSLYHFDTRQALHDALARSVAEQLALAIAQKGTASLMVSGGSTPPLFLERLSKELIDWSNVRVGLVDERWVDENDDESNGKMVRQTLLQNYATQATFVPMYKSNTDATVAVVEIEKTIKETLMPFDVVILGMGADGHTASLFPHHSALDIGLDPHSQKVCIALTPDTAPHTRISLTLYAILTAKVCYLHIEGERKLTVYNQAVAGEDTTQMPIRAFIHRDDFLLRVYYAE